MTGVVSPARKRFWSWSASSRVSSSCSSTASAHTCASFSSTSPGAIRCSGALVAPPAVRVYFTNSPVRRSRTPRKSPASPTGQVSGVGRSLIFSWIRSISSSAERPGRSHLLMTVITGMPRSAQTWKSLSVCGSRPLPASTSMTAESTADSTR